MSKKFIYVRIIAGCNFETGVNLVTINYDRLWKLMIDKKINKTELCKKSKITTNAMAKLGKNKSVQLEVLAKICSFLGCRIEDILEFKGEEKK